MSSDKKIEIRPIHGNYPEYMVSMGYHTFRVMLKTGKTFTLHSKYRHIINAVGEWNGWANLMNAEMV